MTRGKRLRLLRKRLDVSQDIVADLTEGLLQRPEITNAENDRVEWRSDKLWRGLGRAFGLTREELEGYLDGIKEFPIDLIAGKARDKMAPALAQDQLRRDCKTAAREALARAGLSEDEFASDVLLALERIVRREGRKVSRDFLAERAKEIRERIVQIDRDNTERARVSHQKDSETIRTRR